MKMFTANDIEYYMKDDWVNKVKRPMSFKLQKWLDDSASKRMIFSYIYKDILIPDNKIILDIGAGITNWTSIFSSINNYYVLDIMNYNEYYSHENLFENDWFTFIPEEYDMVIANDIFPNVDQRLEEFINKFLPVSGEIRLSLTYYDNKFYKVKREDVDEIMFIKAWNKKQLIELLEQYKSHIEDYDLKIFDKEESIFPNGRKVIYVKLK